MAGPWSPSLAWKLPPTYRVAFIVATPGALGSSKAPGGQRGARP